MRDARHTAAWRAGPDALNLRWALTGAAARVETPIAAGEGAWLAALERLAAPA